jgi:hypothetical protein
MDLSAPLNTINALEKSLDSLGSWLFFWTALVVIGLIVEYWHEIPESIAAFKRGESWRPLLVIVGEF